MGSIFFFLLLLACPLAMMFMMRGMMGGATRTDTTAQDCRIQDLEQEVARLRGTEVSLTGTEAKRGVAALTGPPRPHQ